MVIEQHTLQCKEHILPLPASNRLFSLALHNDSINHLLPCPTALRCSMSAGLPTWLTRVPATNTGGLGSIWRAKISWFDADRINIRVTNCRMICMSV
jgi:hypothetical protein